MKNGKETIADHAWRQHSTSVGRPMDLSQATPSYIGEDFNGYRYYVDGLGLTHVFINMNPIDAKGFLVDENGSFEIREALNSDELLNNFPALTMTTYVFDGGEHYEDFKPNPFDNRDTEQYSTHLLARVHFPGGLTFHSHGEMFLAMSLGPSDRTLRWVFERWSLNDNEDSPIYLTQQPEYFKDHPGLIKPEFVKLEQPVAVARLF